MIERRSKGELESSHLLAADLFDLGNNHGETTTGDRFHPALGVLGVATPLEEVLHVLRIVVESIGRLTLAILPPLNRIPATI